MFVDMDALKRIARGMAFAGPTCDAHMKFIRLLGGDLGVSVTVSPAVAALLSNHSVRYVRKWLDERDAVTKPDNRPPRGKHRTVFALDLAALCGNGDSEDGFVGASFEQWTAAIYRVLETRVYPELGFKPKREGRANG